MANGLKSLPSSLPGISCSAESHQHGYCMGCVVITPGMLCRRAECRQAGVVEKPVDVTLVFSPVQAMLAAKAGATFVSPFLGRLDDIGQDGMQIIHDCSTIFHNYNFQTEIFAASIRGPLHVHHVALAGADIATMPPKVLEQMIRHPLTDKGIASFLKDWETVSDAKVVFAEEAGNSEAARAPHGAPCVTYIGPRGAGHYVKMVHNGSLWREDNRILSFEPTIELRHTVAHAIAGARWITHELRHS
jgi:hypothetical protein